MSNPIRKWDEDIAALELSDAEKNGLQVYRNYNHAFEKNRAESIVKKINLQPIDLSKLEKVLQGLVTENEKFLPIIVCAYADEILDEMFKNEIPDEVPGGKAQIFGPYGPLSDLASRIKLAFCFDLVSKDLLIDLNFIKKIRNDISHNWDMSLTSDFFLKEPASKIFKVENHIDNGKALSKQFYESLNELQKFRVRLIWMISRLTYECAYYAFVKKERAAPHTVLYGSITPKSMEDVATMAADFTKKVINV